MFSHGRVPHSGCITVGTAPRDLAGCFFHPQVCVQHCEHSSALACDVFVTFACNLSGRGSAIERGSFRPVGFVRLQMQKWKSVRFVAGTGVSRCWKEGRVSPAI